VVFPPYDVWWAAHFGVGLLGVVRCPSPGTRRRRSVPRCCHISPFAIHEDREAWEGELVEDDDD
jgi:hypothetical protein